jgi:hypothetical protein
MATLAIEVAARVWWNETVFRPPAASSARRNALVITPIGGNIMTLKPGEPLSHDDIVFAEELGASAVLAIVVTLIATALGG